MPHLDPALASVRYPLKRERLARAVPMLLALVVVGFAGVMAGQRSEGVDLEGRRVNPLKAASGKLVVLVFVRADCPISNRYAPTLQRLQAEYAGRAVFWLVYPDKDESPTKIREHMQEYGYALSALRDPGHELVRVSQAQITPEVAVFGVRGQLVYHGRIDNWYESVGRARAAPTTHELNDALQDLLAGKMPQVSTAGAVGCSIMDLQ